MLVHDTQEVGLVSILHSVGRSNLSVVLTYPQSLGTAETALSTDIVGRLYLVHAEELRSSLPEDRRVVFVDAASSLPGCVSGIQQCVDVAYVCSTSYSDVASALQSLAGSCGIIAGAGFSTPEVAQAVHDIAGRPPDLLLPGDGWAFSQANLTLFQHDVRRAVSGKLDRILFLTCPQGVDSRMPGIMSEFSGLGISDMVLPYLNVHNSFAHAELDRRRFANDGAKSTNVKNCLVGHYGMVKFALDACFERVMFMEDDCRLAVSSGEFAGYISAMPDNINAAIDYVGVKRPVLVDLFGHDSGLLWGVLPGGLFFDNLTCYILNRDGMRCVVDYFEHCGTAGYRWPVDAADRLWPHLTSVVPVYIPRSRFVVQGVAESLINGREV